MAFLKDNLELNSMGDLSFWHLKMSGATVGSPFVLRSLFRKYFYLYFYFSVGSAVDVDLESITLFFAYSLIVTLTACTHRELLVHGYLCI